MLWLEASTLNEHITVGSVFLIRATLPEKDRLDIMIPLIAGALDPDSFRLVYRWYCHSFLPV